MKIRDYLAETDQAKKLISFADASLLFKENCKCLDGFAFDFDEKINAIKLYIKLYKYKLIDLEDFINKFSENNRFKKLYIKRKLSFKTNKQLWKNQTFC